jgi:hypothetical protein
MKKYILLLWALSLLVLSCSEDKGHYNYKEINEVTISGLASTYNVLYRTDTLRITPQITFTDDDGDSDRYEYIWEVGRPRFTSEVPLAVLGHERDLNYFVELPAGEYMLYMGVTDKETGVRWTSTASSRINVRLPLSRGLLIIGEDDEGYADVNMIAMLTDTVVVKGLLRNNGLPSMRNPRQIMFSGEYYLATSILNQWTELWVMTGDGAYYLDLNTLQGNPENNFQKWVFTVFDTPNLLPVYFHAKTIWWQHGWLMSGIQMVCNDGDYVFRYATSQGGYGDPINRMNATTTSLVKVFPYPFISILTSESNSNDIYYDRDSHRFLFTLAAGGYHFDVLTDNPTDPFPWQQPAGREMVYGENTANITGNARGNSFALMKENTGKWYIYMFGVAGNNTSRNLTSPAKYNNYEIEPGTLPRIDEAKLFAFASRRTLMFYAVGSTLYAYDYSAKVVYQQNLGDEITMIEFNIWPRDYSDFYVATYNPVTKGKLQRYILGVGPNSLDLRAHTSKWDGLVKIVDIDWRNSTRDYPPHL